MDIRQQFGVVVGLLVFSMAALAQPGAPGFIRWSAEELGNRSRALGTTIGADGSSRETLADYGSPTGAHRFRLIRRDGDGAPEQHANIEDVVFIQSGSATLVVGGELVGRTGDNGESRGTGMTGGVRYEVSQGDILHIPADTPHRYLVRDGEHVTYALVRMPALVEERVVAVDAPTLDFEPAGFALWRATELQQRREMLSTRIRPDRSARETLADYGSPTRSHRFRHIHRDADGVPEIHDDIIDLVFVTSGAGQLLVGGEMLDRRGSLGSGIDEGTRHLASAGDMLHIPARTPHGYLVPDGGHITYVLVRVPAITTER